jgi:hypothetical protein
MKHINKYLSSKIKNSKYLTSAFPPVPVIGDILMFLENKKFKYIESEDKTVTQLFKAIENANCPVYTYSEYNEHSWWIRIFIGGKITDDNPMFTLEQHNIHGGNIATLYSLETYTKLVKKYKTYEEFRDRINEYFKWE